ncbi:O-antigen ligase family protein, partial [Vibrio lentus]
AINIPFNIFKNTLWILLFASMICSLLSSNYAIDGLTGEVNLIGVFGSKNYLAFHSSLSFILGFFFLFNKGSKDKLLGILLSMTSMLVVLKANSVGTVGFLCLSILLSSSFIFYQMIRLDKSVKVFIDVILVVLSVFLGSVFIYLFIHGSLDDMIYNMGKDPTLTGRTFLWDIGYYLFLEKPILGYGYEGFFRIGNDGAEDIWEIFHITSRSGFNFHNMYIDTMVEFGSIGLILFVAQLCFFIGLIIRFRYFKFGSKYHFVLLFFTFLFLQTFLESGWSNQFTLCQFFVVYFWVVLRDMEFHSYEE